MKKLKGYSFISLLFLLPLVGISQKTGIQNQQIIMSLNPVYEIYQGSQGYLKVITAPGKSIFEFSYKCEKGKFINFISNHTDEVNFKLQNMQEKNEKIVLLKLVYMGFEEIVEFKKTTETNYDY